MLAQGNALGFGSHRCGVRPERAQESSALSGRTMKPGHDTRGVAPGWHPPRRWRGKAIMFSIKEAFREQF